MKYLPIMGCETVGQYSLDSSEHIKYLVVTECAQKATRGHTLRVSVREALL